MNSVNLLGRLTKDPEIYGKKSSKIAKYTLAVDRPFVNDDGEREADFIRCTVFGKGANFAETYLEKGMMIGVSGCIRTGSYKNEDEETVYTTEVVVNSHYFTGSGRKEDDKKGKKK